MSDLNQSEAAADVLQLSPEGFVRFAHYITGELGIRMPESKMSMIQSRLVRRVRELGLPSVEHYGEYLFALGNNEEREHFINAVTTNKTDFFREPEHFQYLTNVALPSLQGAAKYDPGCIRVWSAACSSGEEPYTIGMVLSEFTLRQIRLRHFGHGCVHKGIAESSARYLHGGTDRPCPSRNAHEVSPTEQ
jgi:chemotaxis protein methyltransferase CheR